MKSTIITLGIAALSINFATATTISKDQLVNQQEVSIISTDSTQQLFTAGENQINSTIGVDNTAEENLVFNPNAVLQTTYSKSIEEVVRENKLITNSAEETIQPLTIEKTQLDYIKEANQIIESNPNQEVYPLDFEAINQAIKENKESHVSIEVKNDLKL